jgi:gliding motility-associated-like protein
MKKQLMYRLYLFLLSLFISCIASINFAQTYTFASLGNASAMPTTGWNLTGNAYVGDTPGDTDNFTNELILTNASGNQSGAVFYNTPINLSVCTNWSVEYDFRIFGGNAADGLAFCFISNPPTGFVSGGGVGIPQFANGLKVVIDTWNNCGGPNPALQMLNGVGYNECAPGIVALENTSGNLNFVRSNTYQHAKITYLNGNVNFYINNTLYLTGTLPVNFSGYMGFTASTGGANDQHSVKNVVIFTDQATSNAGPNVTTCDDEAIQIGTTPDSLNAYSWTPTTGVSNPTSANPTVTINNPGTTPIFVTYTVSTSLASSPGVCPTTDAVVVKVNPSKSSSSSVLVCDTNFYVFHGDTLTLSGNYVDTLSTSLGCDSLVNLTLTLDSIPLFDIVDTAYCIGNSITVQLDTAINYVWNPLIPTNGQPNQYTLILGNTSTYSITATNQNGCSYVDSFELIVHPLPQFILTASDPDPCFGDSLTITTQPANFSFEWTGVDLIDTVGASQHFIASNSGQYTVEAIDTFGCVFSNSIAINVLPLPILNLTPDTSIICLKESVTLTASGAINYAWSIPTTSLINDSSALVHPSSTTTYKIIGTAFGGCIDSTSAIVIVNPKPQANFTVDLSTLTAFTPDITTINTSTGAVTYEWDFGDFSPISTAENPSHHYPENLAALYQIELIATNEFGCKDTAYTNFETKEIVVFYVPNAFTPNGDELNQTFKPVFGDGIDKTNFWFTIYNRWGEVVFESFETDFEWDGTFNGSLVPFGSYTYQFFYKLPNTSERHISTGSFSIIK